MNATLIIPYPGARNDHYPIYPRIELTETCKLLDWPVEVLSYQARFGQCPDRSLSSRIAAVAAVALLSILSLGLYLIYAYRAHTDRWLIHELFHRVRQGDPAKVKELFDQYPQLKTRKLMYAFDPVSTVGGNHSVFFFAIQHGGNMIDELLAQGYDITARASLWGGVLEMVPYAIATSHRFEAADIFRHLLSKGARPWYTMGDLLNRCIGNPGFGLSPEKKAACREVLAQYL